MSDQIDGAVAFVAQFMQPALDARSTRGADAPYGLDVVDEAIVNAVAHRDYAISGSKLRLFVFADRIELYSAGGLPDTITLDEMLYRSFTRSQPLVGFLSLIRSKRTGQVFLESRGEGVRKILEDGKAHSGRRPEYTLFGDEFRLTLWAKSTRWSGCPRTLGQVVLAAQCPVRRALSPCRGIGYTSYSRILLDSPEFLRFLRTRGAGSTPLIGRAENAVEGDGPVRWGLGEDGRRGGHTPPAGAFHRGCVLAPLQSAGGDCTVAATAPGRRRAGGVGLLRLVLRYRLQGNLQAVTDEQWHMLWDQESWSEDADVDHGRAR